MKSNGKSLNDGDAGESSPSFNPEFPSSLVHVALAARSHQGSVRSSNQDHYLTVRMGRSLETLMTNLPEGVLPRSFDETAYGMLVADGLGGMAAGDVASKTALLTLVELVVNTPDWMMRMDHPDNAAIVMQRLTERFRLIDAELRAQAKTDSKLFGMGTTLTVAASLGHRLFIAHIGDSRAYLLTGGRLHQLTRDHTLAQELIDDGVLTPEDQAARAMRNVLTAALGATGEPADPDVQRFVVKNDDQLLLCSDGLTEMVDDATIASTLRGAPSAEEACRALIDLALAGGGLDNVTVVLARYQFPNVPAVAK
ncbi:MAG TPA: protein phosphatase 2C domain-containing protein [Blastocatellia bacterium]|nr:protein phosphatase 2C domain-containing protein [Blastocatellia bacterium]